MPSGKKYERCLVLGGGAAKGFAHIGVLQALEEAGFKPDLIVGCSMGALVGVFYADGVRPHIMRGIAKTISGDKRRASSFIPVRPSVSALFDASRVEEFLEEFFGNMRIENLPTPFACVAVDLESGEKLVFREGLVVPALRATISIPGIFPPVKYGKRNLVDGGVLDPLPVDVARDLGAAKVLAVNVMPHAKATPRTIALKSPVKKESVKLLAEIASGIKHLREINIFRVTEKSLAIMQSALIESRLQGPGAPEMLVDVPVNIGYLDFHRAQEAVAAGYEAAQKLLGEGGVLDRW